MSTVIAYDFRRLWAAQGVSAFGSQVTALALPLAAAATLGAGPLALGVLTAAGTAAYLPLALPVGVWVDRASRRRPLLIAADLLAAAALLAVPLALLLGLLTVPLLVGSSLLVGACSVVHRTAFAAHLPDVVPGSALMSANSRFRSTDSAAQITGPGLAGALVAITGPAAAVLLDAASFVLSAVFLARLRTPERPPMADAQRQRVWRSIAEGGQVFRADRRLRAIAGAAATINLAGSAGLAVLVLFATRELHLGPQVLGLVLAAGGVGALLGALCAPRLTGRWGAGRTIVAASAAFSLCVAAMPLASGPRWVAAGILAAGELLGGLAVMVFDTTTGVAVTAWAPRQLLGRVWATMAFLTQSAKPLGALLGGVLGQQLGLRPAVALAAVLALTSVTWTWFSPLRSEATAGALSRAAADPGRAYADGSPW